MTSEVHRCSIRSPYECFHLSGYSEPIVISEAMKLSICSTIKFIQTYFKERGMKCHWCKNIKGELDHCNLPKCCALEHGFNNLIHFKNGGYCHSLICLDFWLKELNECIKLICTTDKVPIKKSGREGKKGRKDLAK